MIKVTKRKMGRLNVTVKEHFPDDPEDMNKIRDAITEFYISEFRKMYPEEVLDIAIPVYQRALDLGREGHSYEESKSRAIKEYEDKKIKPVSQSA